MIQQEQLQLDFAAPVNPDPATGRTTASIHELDTLRSAREAQRRARVYDAISETIRHIDVGRVQALAASRVPRA